MIALPAYLLTLVVMLLLLAAILGTITHTLETRMSMHRHEQHCDWGKFWEEIGELVRWLLGHHPHHGPAVRLNTRIQSVHK